MGGEIRISCEMDRESEIDVYVLNEFEILKKSLFAWQVSRWFIPPVYEYEGSGHGSNTHTASIVINANIHTHTAHDRIGPTMVHHQRI